MIDLFRKLFNKPNEDSSSVDVQNTNTKFVLIVSDDQFVELEIGTLEFQNEEWFFQYSDEFKSQDKYNKIVGFPEFDKVYTSKVLWPFFKVRIPGLKQPLVKEIIEKEQINRNDEASLLKRFGRRNTSSPYILELA